MPRPRVPVEIQKANHRLSKKQIEERTTIPIVLGDKTKIVMPLEIKNDPVAKQKWTALAKLYKGKSYVTSADTEIIVRVCQLYSVKTEIVKDLRLPEINYATKIKLQKHLLMISRHITELEDKLFLNPLVRKRGLPPEQCTPPQTGWEDFDL